MIIKLFTLSLSIIMVSSIASSEETERYVEHGFNKIDCWEIKSAIFMHTSNAIEARRIAIDAVNKGDSTAFSTANSNQRLSIKNATEWSIVYNAICKN